MSTYDENPFITDGMKRIAVAIIIGFSAGIYFLGSGGMLFIALAVFGIFGGGGLIMCAVFLIIWLAAGKKRLDHWSELIPDSAYWGAFIVASAISGISIYYFMR